MEGIFNYLKLYIIPNNNQKSCYSTPSKKLIENAKYLIVRKNHNNNITSINIGSIFSRWSNQRCLYHYKYYNSDISVVRRVDNNYYYYQLVDDFSLSYCTDIIQTFYSFINYDLYIKNNKEYIYVWKNNYEINIDDSQDVYLYTLSTYKNNPMCPFLFPYKFALKKI